MAQNQNQKRDSKGRWATQPPKPPTIVETTRTKQTPPNQTETPIQTNPTQTENAPGIGAGATLLTNFGTKTPTKTPQLEKLEKAFKDYECEENEYTVYEDHITIGDANDNDVAITWNKKGKYVVSASVCTSSGSYWEPPSYKMLQVHSTKDPQEAIDEAFSVYHDGVDEYKNDRENYDEDEDEEEYY